MRRLPLSCSVTALAAVALFAQDASAQCQGPFAGGAIPATGTGGGGTFPGVLPPSPGVFPSGVVVVPAGTVLKSVKLNGLSHTWGGDVTMFIETPAQVGRLHTLFSGGATDPNIDWIGNNYEIVDPLETCRLPLPLTPGAGAPNGIYAQNFNGYAGPANTVNTPLQSVPVGIVPGVWTLYAYDYVALDIGSLTDWELCFGPAGTTCPPPPPPCVAGICVAGGAGGPIPGTGAADGTWQVALPLGPMTSTILIATPGGSTQLQSVKLLGLTHTWRSDPMVTLTDPGGMEHIIFAEDNSINCGGCADDFGGDYTFVDGTVCTPANGFIPTCGVGVVPPGEYAQTFGGWVSGNAGLLNTPICNITVPAGSNLWTVKIYDWCTGFDNGGLVSWDLCFKPQAGPIIYCTAGTTTNGCLPSISASAQPSVTLATNPVITVANVEGQKQGLIFYGLNNSGFVPPPWGPGSSSFLCVKAPTQRMTAQSSGGTVNACDGTLTQNWNAFQTANPTALGNPFTVGQPVFLQGWFRDPAAPKTTNLSNGAQLTCVP